MQPLGVTQSVWEPAVMRLHLGVPAKRPRERTKTSQFAADDGTIESHAKSMTAWRDATAPLCATEASS